MTLIDVVQRLGTLPEDAIICARRPWTLASECVVVAPDERFGPPKSALDHGFDYFLEVFVATETLDMVRDRPVSVEDRVRLLIHYAEFDAYPDWVY